MTKLIAGVSALLFFTIPTLAQTDGPVYAPMPREVRIAPSLAAKMLVHSVDAVCRLVPMGARVSGTVVIAVVIGQDGSVIRTKVVSGPTRLIPDVLAAVRRYRYKPYLLNNVPVKVDTTVSVTLTCE